jgi:hypothetical protein
MLWLTPGRLERGAVAGRRRASKYTECIAEHSWES